MTLPALTVVIPKEINVGGTLMCSKVPLIESFPPIDGSPSAICIFSEPRSALIGLPQTAGSWVILSKYSWHENLIFSKWPPAATTLAQASIIEYAAPWYGLHLEITGLKPNAIILAVSV